MGNISQLNWCHNSHQHAFPHFLLAQQHHQNLRQQNGSFCCHCHFDSCSNNVRENLMSLLATSSMLQFLPNLSSLLFPPPKPTSTVKLVLANGPSSDHGGEFFFVTWSLSSFIVIDIQCPQIITPFSTSAHGSTPTHQIHSSYN